MKKVLFILLTTFISISSVYGFKINEPIGGTVNALGGLVLDKNLDAFNVIYNPNLITMSLNAGDSMNVAASYADSPYGIAGINNSSFAISYAHSLSKMVLGYGIGAQMDYVDAGISEYRFYATGSIYYTDLKNVVTALKFIDGLALCVNIKPMLFTSPAYMEQVVGFQNNPFGVDLDLDFSVSLFNKMASIGFMVADMLETELSFFDLSSGSVKRSMILHLKVNPLNNFSLFGSFNFGGSEHFVNKNNFLGSSTAFANTYFGIEGNFSDSLFVRIGLNEGCLAGGIGLNVEDLTINVGIRPIASLQMYYQVDINYRFDNLFKKAVTEIENTDSIGQ